MRFWLKDGSCRWGYVIGLVPPHFLDPPTSFDGSPDSWVKSALGEDVYARSEMPGHVTLLRDLSTHAADSPPGMEALEDY